MYMKQQHTGRLTHDNDDYEQGRTMTWWMDDDGWLGCGMVGTTICKGSYKISRLWK